LVETTAPKANVTVTAATSAVLPGRRGGDVRPHFPCFDGFRAIAALAVVGVHVTFLSGFVFRHGNIGDYTARLDIGVALFFLISGFLLYRPFVAAHLAGLPAPALRPYVRRRLLRIVPAYWVALTIVAFVLHDASIRGPKDAIIYYGFLQIYSSSHLNGGITQAWSLCTEMSFYAFLPLWAWAVRTVMARVRRPLAVELAGLAGLYIGSLALRGLIVHAIYNHSIGVVGSLYWLPATLDLFAAGMLLAVISAWSGQRPTTPRWVEAAGRRPWLWWLAAAVTYWFVCTQIGLPRDLGPLTTGQWVVREALYGLFSFLLLAPGVFGPQDRGLIRRFLRLRGMVWLGLVSYGIYLWHNTVLDEFRKHEHVPPFGGHFISMAITAVVGSILVATASYLVVEKPALRWKGRP
jgi:peptidoglycan/LPS O-acetylase OafA/YrhL